MATLINLRQVRKVKAREQRADSAAEQRVRYGRSAVNLKTTGSVIKNMDLIMMIIINKVG